MESKKQVHHTAGDESTKFLHIISILVDNCVNSKAQPGGVLKVLKHPP